MSPRTSGRISRVAASAAFVACFVVAVSGMVHVADRQPGSRLPGAALAGASGLQPAGGSSDSRPRIGRGLYARDLAPRRHCSRHWCLHWVGSTADAPLSADADRDGVPDTVERAVRRLEEWSREHASDQGRIDVYLVQLDEGLRGWCTGSACAVDNDFSQVTGGFGQLVRETVTAELAAQTR